MISGQSVVKKFETTGHVQHGEFIGDSGVIGGITLSGSSGTA